MDGRAATLASLRPGGYDYAYPTKIWPLARERHLRRTRAGATCTRVDSGNVCPRLFWSPGPWWPSPRSVLGGAEQARAWVRESRSVDASLAGGCGDRGRRLRSRPSADWVLSYAQRASTVRRALPQVPLSSLDEPGPGLVQCPTGAWQRADRVSNKQVWMRFVSVHLRILFTFTVNTSNFCRKCHISNLKDDAMRSSWRTLAAQACPGARRCCRGPWCARAASGIIIAIDPGHWGFRPWRSRQRPAKGPDPRGLPGSQRRTRVPTTASSSS